MAKMPKPAIKARFMISSLWKYGGRQRPREANVPGMPAKKSIQNEELAPRGNAPRRFIRQREPRPSVACKGGCHRAGSREPLWVGFRGLHFGKHTGEVNCFSRNVRHEQPVGHALLELPDHRRLGSEGRDRQCLACGRLKLDHVSAVSLRTVDHDPVMLGYHRSYRRGSLDGE